MDRFVHDAVSLRITPFMLDTYANEYEELVRTRDAHAKEVDDLRNSNRALHNQVYAFGLIPALNTADALCFFSNNLENSLAQLNTEHCEVLVSVMSRSLVPTYLTLAIERARTATIAQRRDRGGARSIQTFVGYFARRSYFKLISLSLSRYAEAMHQNEDAMSSHRLSTNLTRSRSSFGMN